MALYSVYASNIQLISSSQLTSECLVTSIVPGDTHSPYQISTTVKVAIGASPSATNTNILTAAVSEIQRVYSIAVNAGGTDASGLGGGRNL